MFDPRSPDGTIDHRVLKAARDIQESMLNTAEHDWQNMQNRTVTNATGDNVGSEEQERVVGSGDDQAPSDAGAERAAAREKGDEAMTEKRPMTEAEERLVEAALEFRRLPEATEARATARRNVDAWANAVENERQPRPITPEERAVVEAAKAHVYGGFGTASCTYLELEKVVRRLP